VPRSFQVEKGKKYYICAKIKTKGEITGVMRIVYGAVGEPRSNSVRYNSDWTESGVSFIGGKHPRGVWGTKKP